MEAMDCQCDGVVLARRKGTNGQERPETNAQFAATGCQIKTPCSARRSGESAKRIWRGLGFGNSAVGSRDFEAGQPACRPDGQADPVASWFSKAAVCSAGR